MITKLSHPVLYVKDQDAALSFYTDKLGFVIHTDAPCGDMRWLTVRPPQNEHEELVIFKATKPESEALVGKQSPEAPFLCFITNDCAGDISKFKEKGVKIVEEPNQQPWGTQALFLDLYGNLLMLLQL